LVKFACRGKKLLIFSNRNMTFFGSEEISFRCRQQQRWWWSFASKCFWKIMMWSEAKKSLRKKFFFQNSNFQQHPWKKAFSYSLHSSNSMCKIVIVHKWRHDLGEGVKDFVHTITNALLGLNCKSIQNYVTSFMDNPQWKCKW